MASLRRRGEFVQCWGWCGSASAAWLVPYASAPHMPNILVIDSDPAQRAALVRTFDGMGVIEHAGSGLDALRVLATKRFSVIVLDLQVHPLDGFIILRALATKGGPNRETPVYALAADVAEQDRALREHAVFVLIKPIPLATVKTLVEAGLNRPRPTGESPHAPRVAMTPSIRPNTVAMTPPVRPNAEPTRPSPSSLPAKTSPLPPSDRARAAPPPGPGTSGERS